MSRKRRDQDADLALVYLFGDEAGAVQFADRFGFGILLGRDIGHLDALFTMGAVRYRAEGVTAGFVDQFGNRFFLAIHMSGAPIAHENDHRPQFSPFLGKDIFITARAFAIQALFENAVGDQVLQARGQHISRQAQGLLPLFEPAQTVKRIADNQQGPGLADNFETGRDGAPLLTVIC